MILCVTLNPCLDKTLLVPEWQPGQSVRGRSVRWVVGGKGNNLARGLRRLGETQVRPVTFFGGSVGLHCIARLKTDDHLDPLYVETESTTRVILTVRTQETNAQTAFFDPDPLIHEHEARTLFDLVASELRTGQVRALTLSGSSPCTTTHAVYAELVALSRRHAVPVLLDTYGPALAAITTHWPNFLHVNRAELAQYLRLPATCDADALRALAHWGTLGVQTALVTDGPNPALACLDTQIVRVLPPRIEAVNPVGSGDSLAAGLIFKRNAPPLERLRFAIACGSANAATWDAASLSLDLVESLCEQVVIEPL